MSIIMYQHCHTLFSLWSWSNHEQNSAQILDRINITEHESNRNDENVDPNDLIYNDDSDLKRIF